MEQFTFNGDKVDFETTAVKIKSPQQVMIEKWQLVLLIVGCTSFLFLIYFPIDFFLYRRRKRMARERQSQSACRPSPVRAAQCHAKVTPPDVSAETNFGELDEIEQRKYRAQRGVIKFLNMLKMKKSSAERIKNGGLTENVSTANTSSLRVNIIPEPEMVPSLNGSAQFLSENDVSTTQRSNYTSYDDDYLDYTPEKSISNSTKRWNENQDVYTPNRKKSHLGVKFDSKMSKFASYQKKKNVHSPSGTSRKKKKTGSTAMGPLENTTDFLVESPKEYSRNSIRANNEKITNIGKNENHIHVDNVNNISKIHQEVISKTNNLSSVKTSSENVSDDTTSGVDSNNEVQAGSASKYAKDDTALMFQTDKERKPFARYKKLNHTQSEMCMVRKPNPQKRGKRNVISPLCSDTFTEQMIYEESSSSDKSMPISIPIFTEYSETQKVLRKKKKKSVLKRDCSDSMPDLFYKTEKFNGVK